MSDSQGRFNGSHDQSCPYCCCPLVTDFHTIPWRYRHPAQLFEFTSLMIITRCVGFSRLYIHPITEHPSMKQLLNILFYIFCTFIKELVGELAVTCDMPKDTYHRSRMTEPSAQSHPIQNQKIQVRKPIISAASECGDLGLPPAKRIQTEDGR